MAAITLEVPDDVAARFEALPRKEQGRLASRLAAVISSAGTQGVADGVTAEEFARLNRRRSELLEKRDEAGWTAQEEDEFREVQRQALEYVERRHPTPLPETAELEGRLLSALGRAGISLPEPVVAPTDDL